MATSGSSSVTVTSWDTLKFSWSLLSQSVANNTSTVSWTLQLIAGSSGRISSTASKSWSVTVNGTTYSGTNTVGIANNATKTLASGTTTIPHNSDGTKTFSYSFSQQFSITFSGASIGTKSGSGAGTLNTIARVSNPTLNGTVFTITKSNSNFMRIYTNRQSTSFTHHIYYSFNGGEEVGITANVGDYYDWYFPNTLANNAPNSASNISGYIRLYTFSGNTNIGSKTVNFKMQLANDFVPSCSISVSDTMGYASTFNGYVQAQSKLKIAVTASGNYGSTIKSYKTTFDGKTYTAASVTTDAIAGSGNLTINTTVTDTRGRTATASTTVSVLSYTAPQISSLTVNRCDADGNSRPSGEYLAVMFGTSVTPLNNQNTARYSVQYKKADETSYTTETLDDYEGQYSVDDGIFIFKANSASSYDIIITATDAFKSTNKTRTGTTAKKLWSTFKNKLGFAFGKIVELENVLDIGFKTRFYGGILHPALEPDTDLNDVLTPNTYVGANVSTYNYANCPLTSGTFSLEVVGMGEEGQVKQRLTYCHKTESRVWERIYYSSSWGEWVCVSDFDGQLLWEGGYYMTTGHVAPLSEPVSKQKSGIVLVFSQYDVENSTRLNTDFSCHLVPKLMINKHSGSIFTFVMATAHFGYIATKTVTISNEEIVGTEFNNGVGTLSGIDYKNNRFVLRYVIGV